MTNRNGKGQGKYSEKLSTMDYREMRDYCYRLVTFLFIFLGGPHSLSRFRFYKNHRNLSMGRKCQRLANTRTKFLACKYSIACHNTGRYGGNISGWVGGGGGNISFNYSKLQEVANFGDGDCGASEIHTHARAISRRHDAREVRVYFALTTIAIAQIRGYSQCN